MARTGRRDCRTADRKKNHMNARVEEMKKKIRKAKKEGKPITKEGVASEAPPVQLTPAAASFLSQMRADVTAELAGAVNAIR
jgi:hypothetical protein